MNYNPIICALDTGDENTAIKLIQSLKDKVFAFKIGFEFFSAFGIQGLNTTAALSEAPVFLDLKFHDIPNTIAAAIRVVVKSENIKMLTVHTSGGMEMLKAAIDALNEVSDRRKIARPMLLGVTVLTSMDNKNLKQVGVDSIVLDQVLRLAELAVKAGLDGCVCSGQEIEAIRKRFSKNELKLVVPGIRPAGSHTGNQNPGDQKRVATPREAIEKGADYIVIGRPITEAKDPAAAAAMILREVRTYL